MAGPAGDGVFRHPAAEPVHALQQRRAAQDRPKTRTEIYQIQRNIGMRPVDEIRDLEDLEPLPGGQGNENIPLEVMIAMARSIRGIPNSMLHQTTLEMDLAADKLQELEKPGPRQAGHPGHAVRSRPPTRCSAR